MVAQRALNQNKGRFGSDGAGARLHLQQSDMGRVDRDPGVGKCNRGRTTIGKADRRTEGGTIDRGQEAPRRTYHRETEG
eukprot:11216541-Heterocapsa_arctica.AAC.1